ncbi:MAG: PH domain-containing protein [Candidatus Tenebribacter burtonii]|nr:PH domain-containing protein [Candidatus Tenebribacter burtonii]
MEIRPDKKLITKSWLTLITISIVIMVFALLLLIIPALDSDIAFSQFTYYLWLIIIGVILLMWIITVPIMILWIKNLTYFIEDDKIVIKKGILTKIKQNIPFRMITDFMLERTLYDRWLGIGSIKIQTAGQTQNATGYEGKLSGLINWDELHETLRSDLTEARSSSKEIADLPKVNEGALENILIELKKISNILEKGE